ncbi:MAG: leucine-rich repeat domain-containing protein [Treponema sp.]|nr:leucine-rich repeat domain-containing protein [Treponema sp.]
MKIILFFTLIIFSFIACNEDDGIYNKSGVYTVYSIDELEILLNKLPANTAGKPYTILLNINDLTGISLPVLKNTNKFINFDLSGSTITGIENRGFQNCYNITGVTLPDSITSIGECAFNGCTSIISVNIPNNVTSIGEMAFAVCYKLESINIPHGITIIENGVFQSCKSLTSINIPNNVTNIGDFALFGCVGLTSITIPNNVRNIGKGAFAVCTNLTGITIPNSVASIGEMAFSNCTNITSINIPNSVTYIGDTVFNECKNFYAINVDEDNAVYSSTNGVLYNKDKTTLLSYPQGKTDSVFPIPNSVTAIEYAAFARCTNLTSVILPNSIAGIGDQAFADCAALTNVTFQGTIPLDNFSYKDSFPGGLRDKFYKDDAENGTPGTYTREAGSMTWIKQ